MKYVKEIMWIIAFTFLGELLNTLLPLPVPAGVYGMILLLIALVTGIVKLPEVEGAGNFLLDTMTMMFIPAAVGIMSAIDILLPVLLPYLVIIVVSTVLVMIVTGLTATAILRRSESKEDQAAEDAELSLEPHETFGIGRRTLSPNGEIDGANGYREILHEKEVQRRALQAEANASDEKTYYIRVLAGTLLSKAAQFAATQALSGMEALRGIPGTLGGAVTMNAGAYGTEMKDVLYSVDVLTPEGELQTLTPTELALGYRHSVIPERGYIVVAATLALKKGDPVEIQARMADFQNRRKEKQPLDKASAGSTFKRPEGYFAGKLIEDTGLRGFRHGGAQVSEKHCGFIINDGTARAADIYWLIGEVRKRVLMEQHVELTPEVKLWGEF